MANPHEILDYSLAIYYQNHKLVKKRDIRVNSNGRIRTSSLQIFFCLKNLLRAWICLDHRNLVFREFDTFAILYLFLPKGSYIFNINHNLSSEIGRLVCRCLSFRFEILMIDASRDLIERYPYIKKKSFIYQSSRRQFDLIQASFFERVILFVGSRPDQLVGIDKEEVEKIFSILSGHFGSVQVLGKNLARGEFLDSEEFESLVVNRLCVCVNTYRDRHAGTLWTLVEKGAWILYRSSNISVEQLRDYPFSCEFVGSEDFELSLIESLRRIEGIGKN